MIPVYISMVALMFQCRWTSYGKAEYLVELAYPPAFCFVIAFLSFLTFWKTHDLIRIRHLSYALIFVPAFFGPLINAFFFDSIASNREIAYTLLRRCFAVLLNVVFQGVWFARVSIPATALILPGHMCYVLKCVWVRYYSSHTEGITVLVDEAFLFVSFGHGPFILFPCQMALGLLLAYFVRRLQTSAEG
jgi:hypothetical protein